MVFLFVGSSALTEASFPRNLTVPQLLLSSAWAMLTLVMRASLTVFPHRGLSPHQFMPMSGAHESLQATAAAASVFNSVGDSLLPGFVAAQFPAAVPEL